MQNFRDLEVWAKAHMLVLAVWRATETFPTAERFGITSRMRRAAVSVPTNIAEGCVRSTDADFSRFLHISMGSASELEYLLLLSRDLELMPASQQIKISSDLQEVKRMLTAPIARLIS